MSVRWSDSVEKGSFRGGIQTVRTFSQQSKRSHKRGADLLLQIWLAAGFEHPGSDAVCDKHNPAPPWCHCTPSSGHSDLFPFISAPSSGWLTAQQGAHSSSSEIPAPSSAARMRILMESAPTWADFCFFSEILPPSHTCLASLWQFVSHLGGDSNFTTSGFCTASPFSTDFDKSPSS